MAGISCFEKINEEELEAIMNDCDPIGKISITITKLKTYRKVYFKKIILRFLRGSTWVIQNSA